MYFWGHSIRNFSFRASVHPSSKPLWKLWCSLPSSCFSEGFCSMKLGKPNYTAADENEGDPNPKASSPDIAPPATSPCSEFSSEFSLRQVALVGNPKLSMWVLCSEYRCSFLRTTTYSGCLCFSRNFGLIQILAHDFASKISWPNKILAISFL